MCPRTDSIQKLISDPKRWTQTASMRKADGSRAYEMSEASCFCLAGMSSFIYGLFAGHTNRRLATAIRKQYPEYRYMVSDVETIVAFNDKSNRTVEQVTEIVKLADV